MHRLGSLIVLLLGVATLSACSGGTGEDGASQASYERPGWMAAQVQADEELIESQASCLEAAGYVFTVAPDGRFEASAGTDDAAFSAELSECTAQALGDDAGWRPGPDELRQLYARQLDVVDCLEHEGYGIDGVPSEDAYVDSGGEWTPYDDIVLNDEAQIEMKGICPDPGPASL